MEPHSKVERSNYNFQLFLLKRSIKTCLFGLQQISQRPREYRAVNTLSIELEICGLEQELQLTSGK